MEEMIQCVFTTTTKNDSQFGCEGQIQNARIVVQLYSSSNEEEFDAIIENARSLAQTAYVIAATQGCEYVYNHNPKMQLDSLGTIGLVYDELGEPVFGVIEIEIENMVETVFEQSADIEYFVELADKENTLQ
jgi:hypothetical protein